MRSRRDVVVVGAGLAGLWCAAALARAGLDVLLVDARASVSCGIRTTGIFVRRTLQDYTLPESCLGPGVRHISLYSPALRRLDMESPVDEFRVGRMGPLYAAMLEEGRREGVEWSPRTRYVASVVDGDTVVVRLERQDGQREVRAWFLVGADGAGSRVAADLGLGGAGEWIVGVEDVYQGSLDGPPRFHCFLDPVLAPGYIAWVVHDGEEAHVGVGGYAERFRPAAALRRFTAKLGGMLELPAGAPVERRGGRIPVGGVSRRIASRYGLLVGDAAGAVSPLTAGGLDPCVRLSDLAADVIVRHLGGEPDALARFDGARFRRHFRGRLVLRRLLASVRRPELMEIGFAALRLPPGRRLARRVFFGRGSFPDAGGSRMLPSGSPDERVADADRRKPREVAVRGPQ